MNYRTMLKGALALSLGLIVGTASAANTTYADTQLYGATFESATSAVEPLNDHAYVTNTLVTTYTATEGGATYGWLGAAEDESKIVVAHGGQALQLNTESGTLTNKLAPTAVAAPFNTAIAGDGGAYIETEAKFVASDTLDAGVSGNTDDTKFAIYAYADENASPCTTNLVVYHGVMDTTTGNIWYTNEVFAINVDTEVYTKIRVEMKSVTDSGEDPEDTSDDEDYNVFSVKVGDTVLSSVTAYEDEKWFLTVEQRSVVANRSVTSINFKGTGEVDNLAVGTMTATTTYAIDWSASQNVIASNLTDSVQLAAGDTNFANQVQLAFYPTEGAITNINGVTQSPALDVFTYTVNAADTNLTILAGVEAAPPATVISVATVGNAAVTDNQDGTYTISVPLGNGLSSVYVNGAAVDPSLLTEGQGGTYTLDLSGASGNVNVVIATQKVRTPIGHKWYENPGVIATNIAGFSGAAGPYKFSVGSNFAAISYGNHNTAGTGFKLFEIDDLLAGNATAIYDEPINSVINIASIRGAAICEALDVALVTAYNGGKVYAFPLSTNVLTLGTTVFEITNDRGITFDRAYFSYDNQYLYTTEVDGGDNKKIAKWAIADGLKGSGQKLTLVTEYPTGSRVRDFAYAKINGKELLYVLQNDTAGVGVYDIAAGTFTQLTAAFTGAENYGSVAISMTSTSTPTLTVLPSKDERTGGLTPDPLAVYQLAADGLSINSTLATFTRDDLIAAGITAGLYIRTAMPSEDDETLYLGYGNDNLYVLQYVAPPIPTYAVDWTGSTNVDVTVDGDFWDGGTAGSFTNGTVVTFTPTEGGITNVNGEAVETLRSLDLTVTQNTNIVVLAGAEVQAGYNYPEGGAIEDAAIVSWLTAKGFTQGQVTALTTNAKLNECYLLNCDISQSGAGGSIAITGITVSGSSVTVTVALTRTAGYTGGINGTLKLYGTADLGTTFTELDSASVTDDDFSEGDTTTATLSGGTAKFFKAVVE